MIVNFSQVKIGQKFVFDFDRSIKDGNYYYSYEKVGDNKIKCLTCPKTEKFVGQEFLFRLEKKCHLL